MGQKWAVQGTAGLKWGEGTQAAPPPPLKGRQKAPRPPGTENHRQLCPRGSAQGLAALPWDPGQCQHWGHTG